MDWRRESSMMGTVYSMSYCNISASSSDGSAGLFTPQTASPFRISLSSERNGVCQLGDCKAWEAEIEEGPLNKRGWVLQERFLSPRNIHFGAKNLFWECDKLCTSSEFPLGFPQSGNWPNFVHEFRKKTTSALKKISYSQDRSLDLYDDGSDSDSDYVPDPRDQLPRIWSDLVKIYSTLSFTFRRDKLVALGGMAAAVGQANGYSYVAGLWREELPKALLWGFWDDESPKRNGQSDVYAAPSWYEVFSCYR
jgi:hypothetical protein